MHSGMKREEKEITPYYNTTCAFGAAFLAVTLEDNGQ